MIVVDTHAVVWLTQDRTRLSNAAARVLAEGRRNGELTIADITLQEIALLTSKGRLTCKSTLAAYLQFVESLFHVKSINGVIAERAVNFSERFPHDPADRLIAATAVVNGAPLITRDLKIHASKEVECIW